MLQKNKKKKEKMGEINELKRGKGGGEDGRNQGIKEREGGGEDGRNQ